MDILEVAGGEELERWLAVQNAVFPRRKNTATGLHDWRRQAEDMVWLLASEDGADAGAGLGYVGWFSEPGVAGGEIAVLPDRRGRGIGSALHSTLSVWAAARGARELDLHVDEDDPDSLAWTERRGFVEVGRNSRMVLDLTALDEPAVEPPPGVEIVSWADRPELAPGIYEAAREAHSDIPGEEDVDLGSFEQWLSRDMQGAG
ncbi:MAG: GNAT family N-acetyltransferase, partial [Actinobacteria bacterium]|nr:GNAT family N-acetyltransferase [Actinomycetota bacterium]